jgi:hypothetical protein
MESAAHHSGDEQLEEGGEPQRPALPVRAEQQPPRQDLGEDQRVQHAVHRRDAHASVNSGPKRESFLPSRRRLFGNAPPSKVSNLAISAFPIGSFLTHRKRMMDSDFGNDEFFDGMDKQTARESGLSAGDESTDYFLAMMKRAEIEKQLKAQVKKHGMDYGLDPVGTKDQDTARDLTENHYSRAQILVPKGAKVHKPPEKNPAERLLKAVFGNKKSSGK